MATQRPLSSAPNFSPSCNILQPKRLNVTLSPDGLTARRVLGQKGQLPVPVSHLSNHQLTNLLRNSPLVPLANQCGDNGRGSYQSVSVPKRAPTTMARRNARERNRVKQVNQGFQTLRQHIPEGYRMKKMSKVDTLRCALDYIRSLERILQEDENDGDGVHEFRGEGNNGTVNMTQAVSVSPSTSLSFSSEEEDYLMAQAFAGDFTPTKDQKSNLFGPRIIMLTSPVECYNDENDLDHQPVKLEEHGDRGEDSETGELVMDCKEENVAIASPSNAENTDQSQPSLRC